MTDDDEISLYPLTSVRTLYVRADPQTVVLQLCSGKDVRHYRLALADLTGLAKQLGLDARLLNG